MIPLEQISYYHCVLNFLLTTRMDELNWTTVQPGAACAAALLLARNSADLTRANWKRSRLLKELLLRLGFILNPRPLYWYKFVNYPFCSIFFSWIFYYTLANDLRVTDEVWIKRIFHLVLLRTHLKYCEINFNLAPTNTVRCRVIITSQSTSFDSFPSFFGHLISKFRISRWLIFIVDESRW